MLAFGYNVLGPEYLRYYRFSASGDLVQSEPITLPTGVMMHDFNITTNYVVWMDLPVCFDLELAMKGESPFYWNPDNGARLGVMPRTGTDADIRWFDIDPCYVFHPVNSHEEGDSIVLTVCRSERAMQGGFNDISAKASLWCWTINLTSGTVSEVEIDSRKSDFARVDDRLLGLPARYGYTMQLGNNPHNPEMGTEIYKYDLTTGIAEVHDMAPVTGGEALFVPRSPDSAEDDGWAMLLTYDPSKDRSELRIIDAQIDAQNFSGPPVARVFTPQRVPYGADRVPREGSRARSDQGIVNGPRPHVTFPGAPSHGGGDCLLACRARQWSRSAMGANPRLCAAWWSCPRRWVRAGQRSHQAQLRG